MADESTKAIKSLPRWGWKAETGIVAGERLCPEETPVAIVHDGATSAVMMATPAELEDFAIGFSLSENVVDLPDQIRSVDIVETTDGIEARVWLRAEASARNAARRRRLIGPTGCGLCGIDSLSDALPPIRDLSGIGAKIAPSDVLRAISQLEAGQALGNQTRAIHAAALWSADDGIIIREDVGRHNALDKLIGGCSRLERDTSAAILVLTSRVSVEMVQKAAVLGAPVVCAISAPTGLAVRTAQQAGITLVAIARHDGFEVFTRPDRIA